MTGIPKAKPRAAVPAQAAATRSGYRIRNSKAASGWQWSGLLLIVFGVLMPFFLGLPILVGIALLIVGSIKARGYICGLCGNGVAETSNLCPTCQARLSAEPTLPWGWMTLGLMALLIAGFAYMRPDLASECVGWLRGLLNR